MPWIRLESDIAFSESLFGLSAEAKWLWIFLISYSAKKMSGCYQIDFNYLSHHSGCSAKNIETSLNIFLEKGLLSLNSATSRIANESDRITNESVPNERTNERTNGTRKIVDQEIDYTPPLELNEDKVNATPATFERKCAVIAEIWNDYAPDYGLSLIKTPMSKDRMDLLRKPLAEITEAKDWESIIYQIGLDPFLLGDNDRKWKASFDWLFHKTKYNYRKLLEKYESDQKRINDRRGLESDKNIEG